MLRESVVCCGAEGVWPTRPFWVHRRASTRGRRFTEGSSLSSPVNVRYGAHGHRDVWTQCASVGKQGPIGEVRRE